jgi:hypothetical protein
VFCQLQTQYYKPEWFERQASSIRGKVQSLFVAMFKQRTLLDYGQDSDHISVVGLLIYLWYNTINMLLPLSVCVHIIYIAIPIDLGRGMWGKYVYCWSRGTTISSGLLSTPCGQIRDRNTDRARTCRTARRNPTWWNVGQTNLCT